MQSSGFYGSEGQVFLLGYGVWVGFAIATVEDAAKILILDEVLSVEDAFFREKSLNRIKEMAHGGSMVLIVSHGMEAILKNCMKMSWIEKGKFVIEGELKDVCEHIRKVKDVDRLLSDICPI